MRQTRRSRATPQKNEPDPQIEEAKTTENSAKANLETVFEKEGESKEVSPVVAGESNGSEPVAEVEASASTVEAEEPQQITETENTEVSIAEKVKSEEPIEQATGSSDTKKQSAGEIELSCQVCNCSFTNYHEHMNSEAHKSKINHSNPKTETQLNADAVKSSPKPSATSQALKRSIEQDSAPSPKRMRSQAGVAAVEKFHCDTCNLTILRKQDYDHHMNGKRHLVNVSKAQGKSYCEICKLFFNTITDYNDHTESQLHKKNFAEKKQEKRTFECNVCNVTALAQNQYEQHLTSKRHKRSLELQGNGANPGSKESSQTNEVNGSVNSKQDQSIKKWLYACNACNFVCSLDHQFTAHMNLADHKAAVTDMKNKGQMLGIFEPKTVANTSQNVRKFPVGNAAGGSRPSTVTAVSGSKPFINKTAIKQGPMGPNTIKAATGPKASVPPLVKPGQMKTNLFNKKPPVIPLKKQLSVTKPNAPVNKPPPLAAVANRSNPRFIGNQNDHPSNFVSNPPALKLGLQKMPFDGQGNFGPAFAGNAPEPNTGGYYGPYRPGANFGNDVRNDTINHAQNVRDDFRGDFRGNIREDHRGEIRDIRNIDLGVNNRADSGFRSGFYRESETRDVLEYRGGFRGDASLDVRSDVRPVLGADARGDMRPMVRSDMRNDVGGDIRGDLRGYSSNDIRDMRNDARGDYLRDRNTMSSFGGSGSYGPSYRGSADDYRSENYNRNVQSTGQGTSVGNYSAAGQMASGRYDSYLDRGSSVFSNQYAGSSRGYMGNMSLNGR